MTTATVPTIEAPAGAWQIDPSHTSVGFAVKHLVFTTVKGQFSSVSGVIELDPKRPGQFERGGRDRRQH